MDAWPFIGSLHEALFDTVFQEVAESGDLGRRLVADRDEPGVDATEYSYDEGDRLRLVPQGSQTRVFDYDGRGLLVSEKHPELDFAGNGATFYCNYDSRGNAHRKVEGVAATYTCSPSNFGHNDLTIRFDRAERVTQVSDTVSGDLLKELFYYYPNLRPRPRLRTGRRSCAEEGSTLFEALCFPGFADDASSSQLVEYLGRRLVADQD